MGSQVIRPMVETNKEEYDSEWQETLKAIDIKNRAKSLQNHNYIFDHDEDPRIPKQNPTRTAGGYPKLWFIERDPDRQHPQEPHYAEIKGKKKDDFTALTHYLKNRLPAITLENENMSISTSFCNCSTTYWMGAPCLNANDIVLVYPA